MYGQIIRNLKKSRVRTEILMYLYKIYPEMSYPSEISKHTNIDPTNVIGGLRGMGNRYGKHNSLVNLGLVEKIEENGNFYYRISKTGKKLLEDMEIKLPLQKEGSINLNKLKLTAATV